MEKTTDPPGDVNQVLLSGRLACEPTIRVLPSGDELCSFRLTVTRPPGARAASDSIDCCVTKARPRRTIERAEPGARLEVSGTLHRRFWRSPSGPVSRYEVEVSSAKIIARRQNAG